MLAYRRFRKPAGDQPQCHHLVKHKGTISNSHNPMILDCPAPQRMMRVKAASAAFHRAPHRAGTAALTQMSAHRQIICRQDSPDIAAVSALIQRGTLKRLDDAFKSFFRGEAGFLHFKRRRRWNSFTVVSGVKARATGSAFRPSAGCPFAAAAATPMPMASRQRSHSSARRSAGMLWSATLSRCRNAKRTAACSA